MRNPQQSLNRDYDMGIGAEKPAFSAMIEAFRGQGGLERSPRGTRDPPATGRFRDTKEERYSGGRLHRGGQMANCVSRGRDKGEMGGGGKPRETQLKRSRRQGGHYFAERLSIGDVSPIEVRISYLAVYGTLV